MTFRYWALALCLSTAATGAAAESASEVLFTHKAWEVRVVAFDDGTVSCLAQVTDESRSFTLWADAAQLVQLQFYDDSWDLGEGETANLQVRVDSIAPWTLNDAELHKQSVFFNLPDSDMGTQFMQEVMGGNVIYLNNADGELVESYSLAGSNAAIGALIECVDALGVDSNPFE